MSTNQSNNKRKHSSNQIGCSICKAANRNSAGHTENYCAYEGGPYEGNYSEALAKKRNDERQKKTAASATGGVGIFAAQIRGEIKGSLESHSMQTSAKLAHQVAVVNAWADESTKLQGALDDLKKVAKTMGDTIKKHEDTINNQNTAINKLTTAVAVLQRNEEARRTCGIGRAPRQQQQQQASRQRQHHQQQPGKYAHQQQDEYDEYEYDDEY
jgi:hypothetical protein